MFNKKLAAPITSMIFALTTSSLSEASSPDSYAVKVRSQLCGDSNSVLHGSGFGLRYHNRHFIVTSEHVVIHSANDTYCHSVTRDNAVLSADLVRADWGSGLALLEIPSPISDEFELQELRSRPPQSGSRIEVTGFPYELNRPIVENRGIVILPESPRHLVPLLASMIEVQEAHGEFGMSGGPAVDTETKQLVGLLSHQYLSMAAGKPVAVREFSRQAKVQNLLLLIPSTFIERWARETIDSPAMGSAFVRLPEAQLRGETVIMSEGLEFQYHRTPGATEVVHPGESGEIGGADGTGVGGQSGEKTDGAVVVTAADHVNDRLPTKWPINRLEAWYRATRERVIIEPMSIDGLLRRSPNTSPEMIELQSLPQFFSLIIHNANTWPFSPLTSDNDARAKGADITANVQEWLELYADEIGPNTTLLSEILDFSRILQSTEWHQLDQADAFRLTDTKEPYLRSQWRLLFQLDFDLAVSLLRDVREAGDLLENFPADPVGAQSSTQTASP